MNTFVVEYYSNDNDEWLECSPNYICLDDAIRTMRLQVDQDGSDMAHRIIQVWTHRSTVAMMAYGDEVIK